MEKDQNQILKLRKNRNNCQNLIPVLSFIKVVQVNYTTFFINKNKQKIIIEVKVIESTPEEKNILGALTELDDVVQGMRNKLRYGERLELDFEIKKK